jgi:dTDP-4-amino-4,6-dideoxygalactose transaminase
MHVRINIPTWGVPEVAAGLAASAPWSAPTDYVDSLRRLLRAEVPGWEPVLISSARYGIALAVERLGLNGLRVAVPAYVCPAVLTGLRMGGAQPIAIDCEATSPRFDRTALGEAVEGGRVDAVIAVNTYGVDQDFTFLERRSIPVIEDAAYQAGLLAPSDGRWCGTRADVGVWSFSFKALCGPGGGVLWVRDANGQGRGEGVRHEHGQLRRFVDYSVRAMLRHHIPRLLGGARPPADAPPSPRADLLDGRPGYMSALQAAVIAVQWKRRAYLRDRQLEVARALRAAAVEGGLVPLTDLRETTHLLPCLAAEGAEASTAYLLRRALHQRGIQTEDTYPVLLASPDAMPRARALATRLILLPCHAALADGALDRVASAIVASARDVARQGGRA